MIYFIFFAVLNLFCFSGDFSLLHRKVQIELFLLCSFKFASLSSVLFESISLKRLQMGQLALEEGPKYLHYKRNRTAVRLQYVKNSESDYDSESCCNCEDRKVSVNKVYFVYANLKLFTTQNFLADTKSVEFKTNGAFSCNF